MRKMIIAAFATAAALSAATSSSASAPLAFGGHYYAFVSAGGISWADASVAAAGSSYLGQAGYLATVQEKGFPLPPTYGDHADAWADVQRALAVGPRPTVPCNNDLLAANYLDDGERVWLIDYEYSGNNDACFELGNTSTECNFTPEMTEAWTTAYFGTPTRGDLARVRLQALCSQYGWALWGFIQAATSPIEYDFHSWGMERFDKAEATFRGPDLGGLLQDVAGG